MKRKPALYCTPEPTDEQLRLAYRQMWRPGMPQTFELALAHPVYRVCIRQAARSLNRAPSTHPLAHSHRRNLPPNVVPPTPEQQPQRQQSRPGPAPSKATAAHLHRYPPAAKTGAHDCKKAASNDRD